MAERSEAFVRLIVRFVVDAQWRVVRYKNVHGWKTVQRISDFFLTVEMVATRFVAQTPGKASKAYLADSPRNKM